MKNAIIRKTYKEVSNFCYTQAEKEGRGYAQAAWFAQNGLEEINKILLSNERINTWVSKALELGYTEDDVIINPYISTHGTWYNWASFDLEIPIYSKYHGLERIRFPENFELPKDFVTPFLEREKKEAAKRKLMAEKKEVAEKEQKEKEKAEKVEWVNTHGSDHLHRAVKLGYNCQRLYVTERAALEFPGFTVDFDNEARWKRRSCPSKKGLTELEALLEQGHQAKIMWLINSTSFNEYGDYEPREAIVIRNYLGKYDLVKVM